MAGLLALLLLPAVPAQAQFDTAQVSGIVRDEQGGVVPGATVRITSQRTRNERTYTTNSTGYYVAPTLPPGARSTARSRRARAPREPSSAP